MSDNKCGTYAGWNVHQRREERPCADCREAARLYAKSRRAKGGPTVVREYMMNKARERAVWRLKDMHRADFDLLVADEMRVELMASRRQEETA